MSPALRRVLRRRYWREDDARVVVEAVEDSGLTVTAFARQHGLHDSRVRRWWDKLRGCGPSDDGFEAAVACFAPVRVVEPASDAPPVSGEDAVMEVVLGDDVRVRVGPGFHAAALGRLLEVLSC